MAANLISEEKNLIERALSWFRSNMPKTWNIESMSQTIASPGPFQSARTVDNLINITPPQGGGVNFLVEAKSNFAPRDAERFLTGMARQLRILNPNYPILVVAPWLSERTQEILIAEDINYLDFTGNVRIALNYPPVFITSKGTSRNPQPSPRSAARLNGPKAGRLVRLLVDVTPPYGVSQIAEATGLTLGYVSRLLTSLNEDAIIERARRGQVVSVNIPQLLRRWTQTYDIFKSNGTSSFVAPQGPESVLDNLAAATWKFSNVIVTGSFSAVRFAPVAAPSLLVMYSSEPTNLAKELRLLPADRGSNVVLLDPFDEVVWANSSEESGVRYVSAGQTAADCLTGNGRMPAEGEALTTWMVDNESKWRVPSISELERTQSWSINVGL
jgi:hypothetical protein